MRGDEWDALIEAIAMIGRQEDLAKPKLAELVDEDAHACERGLMRDVLLGPDLCDELLARETSWSCLDQAKQCAASSVSTAECSPL